MRFLLCICLSACVTILSAQDFTMEGGMSTEAVENQVDVLIAPFNEMYLISEIDMLLTDDGVEPQEMRDKLRTYLIRRIDERFSDSLRTRNMLLADDGMLDYLYNGTDHTYKEMEDKGADGSWLKKRLQKKEEEKVYGSTSSVRNGQIERAPILRQRYMSADLANRGMVEYLEDKYHHRYMLYVTQVEMRRDTEKGASIYGETDYTLSVHYSLIDALGSEIIGGKITRTFDREMAKVSTLTNEIFPSIANELFDFTALYLASPSTIIVKDEDDY